MLLLYLHENLRRPRVLSNAYRRPQQALNLLRWTKDAYDRRQGIAV